VPLLEQHKAHYGFTGALNGSNWQLAPSRPVCADRTRHASGDEAPERTEPIVICGDDISAINRVGRVL